MAKKMGRPSKIPRDPKLLAEMRAEIMRMSKVGMRDEDIATVKNFCEATLKEHFKEELKAGRAEGRETILRTAWDVAVNDRNPSLLIFLCKTRCGLSEKNLTNDSSSSNTNSVSLTLNTTDPIEAARVYEEIMKKS